MGGDFSLGKTVPMPPDSDWTPLATYQLEEQLYQMQTQSQLALLQYQQSYQNMLLQIQEETVFPPAPTITEIEDINWTSKIAEMEAAAYEDISKIASLGTASGTLITDRTVWESEPEVITQQLTGT
jgi:hypothetical protein